MSLDRSALARTVAAHGPVMRVVVAEVQGSAPREVGAAMLVWDGGQSGTIGGGALEYDAAHTARVMLAAGEARYFGRALLGPDLGQCCGGAVGLFYEAWDADRIAALDRLQARPVEGGGTAPLSVQRLLAEARASGIRPVAQLIDGWFVESVNVAPTAVWIWGAGHVGRALVATLAPLPDLALTWVDTARDRFPDVIPEGVTPVIAPEITAAVADAPGETHHLVLTYSHALDLGVCDALLTHGFAHLGLIGSATKWARFRSKLGQIGHAPAQVARIQCPIGDKALGKHPSAIAVGVAYGLLMELAKKEASGPAPGDRENGDDGRALDA